ALLRWSGPAAASLPGGLLLVGVYTAAGCGLWQFAGWARARAAITRQINTVTFLVSPVLGWPDLRAGRVRVVRCCYPRRQPAFPKVVKLVYSQHPRTVGDELAGEVGEVLHHVTGRTFVFDHDPLSRALIATETETVAQDTGTDDAEAVLAPLVAAWFDPAAHVAAVTVADPVIVVDEDGNVVEGAEPNADEARKAAATVNDHIAERIREFTVAFVYNVKVSTPYRRGIIESAVSDALAGSWEVHWSMPSRRARFVRCPGLPTLVDPPLEFPVVSRAVIRRLYKQTVIPFAVDAYGNVIVWDFKQSPHFLIAGATSTGKTSLLMTITTQCARRGFNVVWIDPKGFDSPGVRDWPNVSLVTAGFDDDGMVGHTAALRFIADTMRERLALVKINPNRADDFDPIVVITDEFSNLVVALAEFYTTYRTSKEKGTPPTTIDVGVLLRTARAVGIHMAIGIQRPDTMFIAGEARDNTALRVAMGRLRSKDAAVMMFNDPVAGTRLQPGIKGRGTVQLPDGSFREIQAYYTPKVAATDEQHAALTEHEREILRQLADVDSFWPRRVVDSALRDYNPDDPEQRDQMSFAKIRNSPIVLASQRPDLDPLSDQYVAPAGVARKPTMDDAHDHDAHDHDARTAQVAIAAGTGPPVGSSFGAPVDGYNDDYLPTIDDEYGPPIPVTANELRHGDLV
ncbi:MAG TPA: FtsK/SpoIIIE domain-containing protein, partial [Mycobacterium sp.]|nr:FtsK/SpoIIIE domain-containing protein [Mycobacterium sp.]